MAKFDHDVVKEVEEEPRKTERPSINKVVSSKRKTAISSFKVKHFVVIVNFLNFNQFTFSLNIYASTFISRFERLNKKLFIEML